MAEFEPYYPLYAGAYLKGLRELSIEQIGVYTLIVMTCYEARGPILEDYRMLAARCRTNPRPMKRIILDLVEMGRIVRVQMNDKPYLIDERAARELERAEARIEKKHRKSLTDFKGKNRGFPQNSVKNTNYDYSPNRHTEIIGKKRGVSGNVGSDNSENSGGFEYDLVINLKTPRKNHLETVPPKETKNLKNRAHAGQR